MNGLIIVAGSPGGWQSNVDVFHLFVGRGWLPIASISAEDDIFLNDERPGDSVSMSQDGGIIAFGAPGFNNSGIVRVYQYANTSKSYNILGNTIDSPSPDGKFGSSISLSGNGLRLAVGDGNLDMAWMYELRGSTWTMIGELEVPPGPENQYSENERGTSVTLSRDGQIVAVGRTDNPDVLYGSLG